MLGEDLKRLAEEIAASYEARIQGMADLKEGVVHLRQETEDLLGNFAKERREMAENTRAELGRFKEECQQGVADLKRVAQGLLNGISAHQQETQQTLRTKLGEFRSDLSRYKNNLDAAEDQRRKDAAEMIAARKGLIGDIKKETQAALAGFQSVRQESQKELETKLGDLMRDIQQFRTTLAQSEMERKKRVREELKNASEALRTRLSDLMKGLREFQTDLVKGEGERRRQTQNHLKDMRVELNTLFRNLRKDLEHFRAELDKSEKYRKQTTVGELKEMSQNLRDRLTQFGDNISAAVGNFLSELQTSRLQGAAAWREVLSAVRRGPESAPKTAAAVKEPEITPAPHPEKPAPEETKAQSASMESPEVFALPFTAPAETPAEEEVKDEAATSLAPQEGLMEDILDLLRDHPEGLKMVEISEKLGLPNWRSLIPVMRELVDEEEVRKEETLYFCV